MIVAPARIENGRRESLNQALQAIEKQFGKGSIMYLGAQSGQEVAGISTGSISLDLALGGRGVPRGRVIEIFGPESSGKTTLCQHIAANAQRAGGIAAFIDVEHALDPSYARKIGVDIGGLLFSQPDCGEQALEIAESLVRSNAVDVVIIDSVAALVPRSELEGEMGDAQVGAQARLMSQALRKLTGAIARSNTSVIFTNQIREKIGVMFGNPETTSGGRALKFYASVRLEVKRMNQIKDGEEAVGCRTKVTVVKNKIAPPFKKVEFDILFNQGISYEGDVLDAAVEKGLLEKSGTWLSYKETRLGQGRDRARDMLRENPDLVRAIERDLYASVGMALAGTFASTVPSAAGGAGAGTSAGTAVAAATAPAASVTTAAVPGAHAPAVSAAKPASSVAAVAPASLAAVASTAATGKALATAPVADRLVESTSGERPTADRVSERKPANEDTARGSHRELAVARK